MEQVIWWDVTFSAFLWNLNSLVVGKTKVPSDIRKRWRTYQITPLIFELLTKVDCFSNHFPSLQSNGTLVFCFPLLGHWTGHLYIHWCWFVVFYLECWWWWQWKKEMSSLEVLPPGYDPALDVKPKTKSAKRNERKKEKRIQVIFHSLSTFLYLDANISSWSGLSCRVVRFCN